VALVFSLHGLGSDLEQQELLSNMSAKADEAGFVVVYPQAGASVWNVQAGNIGAIDVSFFREMIDYLSGKLSIDPARIYAAGFSNGGGMAHRLACDLSDQIAAIASVSGAHMPNQPCDPGRPVPILAIHGTDDMFAPYANDQMGHNIPLWADGWAVRNQCDPEPESSRQGNAIVETWMNCQAGATVTLYSVEGMGHAWPGFPRGDVVGEDTGVVAANDLIWAFFDEHPMP
jgi:polyhydroxybutyrate depolymerase